ncbi:hypothetical protein [Streptomyces aurantiacus]|uniref:hypothetical protein n=1 Tax=Streptomyces aurantiacus TaxID=47760 RepID=UPI001FE21899|nr:hypothetical protein [Streptomyces aurantiacus]
MSSLGAGPDPRAGDVPDRRMPFGVDRVIMWLSLWWMAGPLIFCTPAIVRAMGFPWVMEEFGSVFWWAAPTGAMVAPITGLVVAHNGRRRKALGRFIVMTTLSSALILTYWVFGVLLAECPDGYHC